MPELQRVPACKEVESQLVKMHYSTTNLSLTNGNKCMAEIVAEGYFYSMPI